MGHLLDFPPAKIYSAAREEWRMRGEVERQRSMLSFVDAEHCVPEDHPIRRIKTLANAELARLSPTFDAIYAEGGRPSIPPAPAQGAAADCPLQRAQRAPALRAAALQPPVPLLPRS